MTEEVLFAEEDEDERGLAFLGFAVRGGVGEGRQIEAKSKFRLLLRHGSRGQVR